MNRNEKCHCGSGKKYKRCCLDKDKLKNRFPSEQEPHIYCGEDTWNSDDVLDNVFGKETVERLVKERNDD